METTAGSTRSDGCFGSKRRLLRLEAMTASARSDDCFGSKRRLLRLEATAAPARSDDRFGSKRQLLRLEATAASARSDGCFGSKRRLLRLEATTASARSDDCFGSKRRPLRLEATTASARSDDRSRPASDLPKALQEGFMHRLRSLAPPYAGRGLVVTACWPRTGTRADGGHERFRLLQPGKALGIAQAQPGSPLIYLVLVPSAELRPVSVTHPWPPARWLRARRRRRGLAVARRRASS